MNSAIRLEKILLKIKQSQQSTALQVFEDVFKVKGCARVVSKLILCHSQIATLKEKIDNNLITYLELLLGCSNLARDISGERQVIDSHIVTLNSMAAFMQKENINSESMLELGELILDIEDKLSKIELSQDHKSIINRYIQEMNESIIDFDIGGIEAFETHITVANGTVVLYHNVFTEHNLSDATKKIYEKSTKILSDMQTWSGILGTVGGYFLK